MIVLMAGLPGTGKSTLAQELAARLSGTILSKDQVRHTLFEDRDVEYSSEQDDFCMEVMLETAGYILRRHPERIVFFDGRTFSKREQVRRVVEFAERAKQAWRIVECVCSEETVKKRLAMAGDHPAGNRDFQLYVRLSERFEEINLPKTLVDTDQPLNVCVQHALSSLQG